MDKDVWQVELAEGPTRRFFDLQSLTGSYYHLKPEFIKRLRKRIRTNSSYQEKRGIIRKVTSSRGETARRSIHTYCNRPYWVDSGISRQPLR